MSGLVAVILRRDIQTCEIEFGEVVCGTKLVLNACTRFFSFGLHAAMHDVSLTVVQHCPPL